VRVDIKIKGVNITQMNARDIIFTYRIHSVEVIKALCEPKSLVRICRRASLHRPLETTCVRAEHMPITKLRNNQITENNAQKNQRDYAHFCTK
jgi:hypothetical protein